MRRRIPTVVAILCIAAPALAQQQTPPVQPRIQQTPLPPAIELPAPPQAQSDVPNRPLTASEAAAIALRRQPNIAAAAGGLEAARGRVEQARSGLLPTVGTGAGYTYTRSLSGGTGFGTTSGAGGGSVVTVSGWQASANLHQLLFDFNHTREIVRQSESLANAAAANLTRTQADTVLQVKQAFYNLLQAQRLVGVNEANVRNQQAHLALAQAKLNSGLGAPSDVVRAQTAVAEAILNLNLARNAASVARVTLAELMGVDPRTPMTASDTVEPAGQENDVNGLVTTALTQRPEMREAQETVRASEHGVSAARTTNAPSLGANLGLAARGANFPPSNSSLSIGASVAWTPWDSGFTAGRLREARGNLQTSQAQLEATRQGVVADVGQAYLNLKTAEQRVTTAQAEVANAEESVRLAEGRFRAGVGVFIEVTDAQAALLTAQTNLVNARAAVDQARAALAHATGTRP